MNESTRLFTRSGLSLERLGTFLQIADAGNIARAAGPDPNRQSQFSRQLKEMETYFGIELARRVGRRIEITADGRRLAALIRQQFRDLAHFRESAAGREVTIRLGAAGSVLEWMLCPRLGACREALRGAVPDLVHSRSAEVVRGVSDGRLDLGIVRHDALPARCESVPLATVGYSLFVPAPLAPKRGRTDVRRLLATLPLAMLLPGGRFQSALEQWLAGEEIPTRTVARVSSFVDAAAAVAAGQAAAVLPDVASSVLRDPAILRKPLLWDHRRELVILWNHRSLDRAGFATREVKGLARALTAKAPAK